MRSIWGDTVCAGHTCVTQFEVLPLISSLICYHLLFKLRFKLPFCVTHSGGGI